MIIKHKDTRTNLSNRFRNNNTLSDLFRTATSVNELKTYYSYTTPYINNVDQRVVTIDDMDLAFITGDAIYFDGQQFRVNAESVAELTGNDFAKLFFYKNTQTDELTAEGVNNSSYILPRIVPLFHPLAVKFINPLNIKVDYNLLNISESNAKVTLETNDWDDEDDFVKFRIFKKVTGDTAAKKIFLSFISSLLTFMNVNGRDAAIQGEIYGNTRFYNYFNSNNAIIAPFNIFITAADHFYSHKLDENGLEVINDTAPFIPVRKSGTYHDKNGHSYTVSETGKSLYLKDLLVYALPILLTIFSPVDSNDRYSFYLNDHDSYYDDDEPAPDPIIPSLIRFNELSEPNEVRDTLFGDISNTVRRSYCFTTGDKRMSFITPNDLTTVDASDLTDEEKVTIVPLRTTDALQPEAAMLIPEQFVQVYTSDEARVTTAKIRMKYGIDDLNPYTNINDSNSNVQLQFTDTENNSEISVGGSAKIPAKIGINFANVVFTADHLFSSDATTDVSWASENRKSSLLEGHKEIVIKSLKSNVNLKLHPYIYYHICGVNAPNYVIIGTKVRLTKIDDSIKYFYYYSFKPLIPQRCDIVSQAASYSADREATYAGIKKGNYTNSNEVGIDVRDYSIGFGHNTFVTPDQLSSNTLKSHVLFTDVVNTADTLLTHIQNASAIASLKEFTASTVSELFSYDMDQTLSFKLGTSVSNDIKKVEVIQSDVYYANSTMSDNSSRPSYPVDIVAAGSVSVQTATTALSNLRSATLSNPNQISFKAGYWYTYSVSKFEIKETKVGSVTFANPTWTTVDSKSGQGSITSAGVCKLGTYPVVKNMNNVYASVATSSHQTALVEAGLRASGLSYNDSLICCGAEFINDSYHDDDEQMGRTAYLCHFKASASSEYDDVSIKRLIDATDEDNNSALYASNYAMGYIYGHAGLTGTHPPVDMVAIVSSQGTDPSVGYTMDYPTSSVVLAMNIYPTGGEGVLYHSYDSDNRSDVHNETMDCEANTHLIHRITDNGDYVCGKIIIAPRPAQYGRSTMQEIITAATPVVHDLFDEGEYRNGGLDFSVSMPEDIKSDNYSFYDYNRSDYSSIKQYLLRSIYDENSTISSIIDELLSDNGSLKQLSRDITCYQLKATMDAQNILALDGVMGAFSKIKSLGSKMNQAISNRVEKFSNFAVQCKEKVKNMCFVTRKDQTLALHNAQTIADSYINDETPRIINRGEILWATAISNLNIAEDSQNNGLSVIAPSIEGGTNTVHCLNPDTAFDSSNVISNDVLIIMNDPTQWTEENYHTYFIDESIISGSVDNAIIDTIDELAISHDINTADIKSLTEAIIDSDAGENAGLLSNNLLMSNIIGKTSQEIKQQYNDKLTLLISSPSESDIFSTGITPEDVTVNTVFIGGEESSASIYEVTLPVTALVLLSTNVINKPANQLLINKDVIMSLTRTDENSDSQEVQDYINDIELITSTHYNSETEQFENPTLDRNRINRLTTIKSEILDVLNTTSDGFITTADISDESVNALLPSGNLSRADYNECKEALAYMQNEISTYQKEVNQTKDSAIITLTAFYNGMLEDVCNELEDAQDTSSDIITRLRGEAETAVNQTGDGIADVSNAISSVTETVQQQLDTYLDNSVEEDKEAYSEIIKDVKVNISNYSANIISNIKTSSVYNGLSAAMSNTINNLTLLKGKTAGFMSCAFSRVASLFSSNHVNTWQEDAGDFDKNVDMTKFYKALETGGKVLGSVLGFTFAAANTLIEKVATATRNYIQSTVYDGKSVIFKRSGYETLDVAAWRKDMTYSEFSAQYSSLFINVINIYNAAVDYNYTLSIQYGNMFIFFMIDQDAEIITIYMSPVIYSTSLELENKNRNDAVVYSEIISSYKRQVELLNRINEKICNEFPDFFTAVVDLRSGNSPFYEGQVSSLLARYTIKLQYNEKEAMAALYQAPYAQRNKTSDTIMGWAGLGFGVGAYMFMSGLTVPGLVVMGAAAVTAGIDKIVEVAASSDLSPDEILSNALSDDTYGNAMISNADIYQLIHTFPVTACLYMLDHLDVFAAAKLVHSGKGRVTANGNYLPVGFVKGSPKLAIHLMTDLECLLLKIAKVASIAAAVTASTVVLSKITKTQRLNRKLDKVNALSWNVPEDLPANKKIAIQQKYQKKLRKTGAKLEGSPSITNAATNNLSLGIPSYEEIMQYSMAAATFSGSSTLAAKLVEANKATETLALTGQNSSAIADVSSNVDTMSTNVTTISNNVDTAVSDIESASSAINSMSSTTDNINTKVGTIQTSVNGVAIEVAGTSAAIAALELLTKNKSIENYYTNVLVNVGYTQEQAEELLPLLLLNLLTGGNGAL